MPSATDVSSPSRRRHPCARALNRSGGRARRRPVAALLMGASLLIGTTQLVGCGTGVTPANPTPAQRASSNPTVFDSATSSASASGGVPEGVPQGAPGSSSMADSTATLRTYGIANGPDTFELPAGLVVIESVDQPNVVTLVLPPDAGAATAAWLVRNLPREGYRIDGSSHDSVVFSGHEWSGSFTSDAQLAGFTLRRNS